MEKFIKFRPLAYLENFETSVMELFCGYRWLLLGVHYSHRNATSYMFHRVLSLSLKYIRYSIGNVLYAL